jgi:hypothetical protein
VQSNSLQLRGSHRPCTQTLSAGQATATQLTSTQVPERHTLPLGHRVPSHDCGSHRPLVQRFPGSQVTPTQLRSMQRSLRQTASGVQLIEAQFCE